MIEDSTQSTHDLEEERAALVRAERLLAETTRELHQAQQALKDQHLDIEHRITERTQALKASLEQAESSTLAKDEFLAMMSHEIRTPLNSILGMSQLLDLTPLNDEQRGYVKSIRTSGDALLLLISDILDYSKIDAGHLHLESREFVLERALSGALEPFQAQAEKKGLALHLQLAPDLPEYVRGDRARLRQILSNIVSNAIKFTDEGEVRIRVLVLERQAGSVLLGVAVHDTGIGIPANRIARLFKPFSQVDSSTTRQFGGSGLGLAIAWRLTRAMGGKIGATSRFGEGSVFRFSVRLEVAEVANESEPAELGPIPLPENGAMPQVLVVDDDLVNRTLAVAMLGKLGFPAEAVVCGEDAVTRVAEGGVDIVLMDVQMPSMDGVQATEFIRGLSLPKQPTIIALTANTFESDRARCFAAGMDHFLAKPVRLEALREKLAAVAVQA